VIFQVLQHSTDLSSRQSIENDKFVRAFKAQTREYDGKLFENNAPFVAFFEVTPISDGIIHPMTSYPKTAKPGEILLLFPCDGFSPKQFH
jgi:hypothetical protein